MTKRVSLKERRAGDAKGIDSIFQGSGAGTPADGTLQGQEAGQAESSAAESVAEEKNPAPTGNALESSSQKPLLSKATVYIRPEQVVAIEAIQLAERQRSGVKPDKSDLVQEALDLLIEKYRTA